MGERLVPLSLGLLRASESAACQLSFTTAVEKLGTIQSTVSQQIKRLEKELATPLFQHVHRGIVLTDAGQLLLRHVAVGPETIDAGIAVLGARQCHEAFQAATDYAFAAYWLTPRLPRFHQAHPHLDVSLVTSECGLVGQCGDIDVAILSGDGRSKYGETHRLFRGEVFSVCSLRLVEGLQLPLAKAHLTRLPMLHLKPAQHARWLDWPALSEALVIDRQPIPAVLSFDSYTLLIQVAIAGQGVAIGWHHLVDGLLEQGLLCRPIGEGYLSRYGHYAVLPERKWRQRLVDGFVDWLQTELQAGGA